MVELDIEDGRNLIGREVCVAEDSLHPGILCHLVDLELLARWVDLLAELGPQLDGQVLGTLAFLIDVATK